MLNVKPWAFLWITPFFLFCSWQKLSFNLSSCPIFCILFFYRWRQSMHSAAKLQKCIFCYLQLKEKYILLPVMEWIPYSALGWMRTRSFRQGMFMLSIKGWAVIKTHFYLNECKLAHLLWWASCPDSSISMIDQLSSCWWLTGNGSWGRDGGRKRNKTAWEKKKDRQLSKTCTRILHLIRLKGIMEFHFTQKGLSLIDINKYNCHFIFKQLF